MQAQFWSLVQLCAGGKHPDLARQSRPDAPPPLWRKGGAREGDVKGCATHHGGIWIDALLQHLGAIHQVEQTDGGSEKRSSFAPRLHQDGAASKTIEEQGNGWRTDTSADINQRAARLHPSGLDELRRIEKEDLCELGIVTRPRKIGAPAPSFRGVEIGRPPGRNRDPHGTAERLDHTHAIPHAVAGADAVADAVADADAVAGAVPAAVTASPPAARLL